jgi:hypothetical protein
MENVSSDKRGDPKCEPLGGLRRQRRKHAAKQSRSRVKQKEHEHGTGRQDCEKVDDANEKVIGFLYHLEPFQIWLSESSAGRSRSAFNAVPESRPQVQVARRLADRLKRAIRVDQHDRRVCHIAQGGVAQFREREIRRRRLRRALRPHLSPEAFAAAQERGRARDLEPTFKELLATVIASR